MAELHWGWWQTAVVQAADKELCVDHEFPVLGPKAKSTGRRGRPFSADLALVAESDSSSSEEETIVSGATADIVSDECVLAIILPPQRPVIVVEYKPKLYERLELVDVSDVTELVDVSDVTEFVLQAFYIKEGYGKGQQVLHILTDLNHFYCFQFGWRPNFLTVEKFQHLVYDVRKVDDMALLQFTTEQVSNLLDGTVQGMLWNIVYCMSQLSR